MDLDIRFALQGNIAPVNTWSSSIAVQKGMALFGGCHQTVEAYKKDGKVNAPVANKVGKDETEAMMTELMAEQHGKILDVSFVSQTWNSTSWSVGMHPQYNQVGFAPNSVALIRKLWTGKTTVMIPPCSCLLFQGGYPHEKIMMSFN